MDWVDWVDGVDGVDLVDLVDGVDLVDLVDGVDGVDGRCWLGGTKDTLDCQLSTINYPLNLLGPAAMMVR